METLVPEVYNPEFADLDEKTLRRQLPGLIREAGPKTVRNEATGKLIEIRPSGIKHAAERTGRYQLVRLHAMLHLVPLLAAARFETTQPDRDNRRSVLAVHTFSARLTYQGASYRAYLQVREVQEMRGVGTNLYYDQYLALEA